MGIDARAREFPDHPAVISGETGEILSYLELVTGSRRLAARLTARGLRPGDHIAIMMENRAEYLVAAWGARRAGLFYTPVNWHLAQDEARYIINDCGAKVLIMSSQLLEAAKVLMETTPDVDLYLMVGGEVAPGFVALEEFIAECPGQDMSPEIEGAAMYYSSGTTGRPKGITPKLDIKPFGEASIVEQLMAELYGYNPATMYLSPAPLYHAAPLAWSMGALQLGGTVVLMERFDALESLRLIESYAITHTQMVPTMFIRMLKLTDVERLGHDIKSLQSVIHAAAPCPVDVKERMIGWMGPIIEEYYAGSEGVGLTSLGSKEWLERKGSVGTAKVGIVHIVDEEGRELSSGETGQIYFEGDASFEYHNDPDKTSEVHNERGWITLGDIGYVDDDGYLYLVDRVSHMIISGGVNIYPQEIENLLALHPDVMDIAVIGVPNKEFGEEVKAIVQLAEPSRAGDDLAFELIEYCRDRITHFKCPKSVDFIEELPRLPNGKLLKRRLRDKYWSETVRSRII